MNKDVIETLSLDIFIDYLTDSDIPLPELDSKTHAEVEKIALCFLSHKNHISLLISRGQDRVVNLILGATK